MNKSMLPIGLMLWSMIFTINAMEKPREEISDILNEGPLKKLNFTLEKINKEDESYYAYGYIIVPEYPDDKIEVAVEFDNDGYIVNFIDKDFNTMPRGLFYWIKSGKTAPTPTETSYLPSFESGSAFWMNYDEELWQELVDNPYTNIPSLQEAFGTGRIYNKHLPMSIREIDKETLKSLLDDDMFRYYLEYRFLTPRQKQTIRSTKTPAEIEQLILSFVTPLELRVMTQKLNDKLKDSGLTDTEPVIKSVPDSGHGTKKDLIRLYIIQQLDRQIKHLHKINVYRLLTEIEDLEVCKPDERAAFNQYAEDQKNSDNMQRVEGITAKGVISCNPGLLVWD